MYSHMIGSIQNFALLLVLFIFSLAVLLLIGNRRLLIYIES